MHIVHWLKNRLKAHNPASYFEKYRAFKNLPPFLVMIWRTHPWMAAANVGLRGIKSVIPVSQLYLGKLIVDEVLALTQSEGDLNRLYLWVGLELGITIISDLLARLITLTDSLLGDLFANKTSVQLMEHAGQLDLDQFEDSAFYDKLERARRQTIGRTMLMSQVLSQLQDIFTILFLAAGLVVFSPWLILLLLIAVIPAFLGETHFNEKSYSLVRSWTPERRELDYLRYTGASDETAKEIKIFGLSNFLIERFRVLSDKFYNANKAIATKRAWWGIVLAALGTLGYYSAYVFIIQQTISGSLTLGELIFLSTSFARLRGLLETFLSRFSSMTEGALYLQDFFEFFQLQPRIQASVQGIPFPRSIKEGFVFENVSFKYDKVPNYALRHLSFTLKAGEKLALVGENGAGKTTLVKLLARLYDPTEGRILLDGRDLREYNVEDLRREIGVIFQDFVKFQLIASENIAVGRIEEKTQMQKIQHSAQLSLADQVIEKLPQKYEQMIGKRFADGVDLSGGQWQKIALGRAYMRDSQILILDEPTAALDARAEFEVFQRFADLTKGKTAVLISHRFSTVRMADRILVIENGAALEIGSHEELLAKDGRYAELFHLQAAGYR
ncbi:ABC transporter ATP-binding protein [Cytophagales bacterium LB-30]|uniref:ABC transporter ATP-binding protein n=1 Tax=Shiella aurantiaca TaxID=3058365 RepID=A0ABT8F0D8_9BACT|nr:ABC transporter ATP-binding protein [Shiella aurantiaca]MDN4163903.1 ABC transporter ATP-binding protein [Shiella aurantiaca]